MLTAMSLCRLLISNLPDSLLLQIIQFSFSRKNYFLFRAKIIFLFAQKLFTYEKHIQAEFSLNEVYVTIFFTRMCECQLFGAFRTQQRKCRCSHAGGAHDMYITPLQSRRRFGGKELHEKEIKKEIFRQTNRQD